MACDERGLIAASVQSALPSQFPQPGWVEQSASAIWESQLRVARAVVREIGVDRVGGIAICNQRETALLWDRETLEPLGPAIVWQCRRTAEVAARLEDEHGVGIRERSGLRPDAYFSGPKIAWLLDHVEGARSRAERGEIAAGTVDSWLLAKLNGAQEHLTDETNASRTMLWNLAERRWDRDLCEWQRVPMSVLAEVRPSRSRFGMTDAKWLGAELPLVAVAGDQQAALYGHGMTRPGAAKCTYGTGAFVLSHAGDQIDALATADLLLTAAADGGYALEGGVFTAGSVIQWLRDELGLAESAAAISSLAASVDHSDGVMLIPAFAGLGAPHWDPSARGALLGLTLGTTRPQIARAAFEAVAFRVREVVEAMEASGVSIDELRVDGGMSASDPLLQIQANALQRPVVRPSEQETTALGAARLAMSTLGWELELDTVRAGDRTIEPNAELEREYQRWTAARLAMQSLGDR